MPTNNKIIDLYDKDAFMWYNENAKLIREKKFDQIDVLNVAEELESMGRHERKILESFLTQLFMHLLKYLYQTERRSKSWQISIKKQRKHALDHLSESPSLKGQMPEITSRAYENARIDAAEETGMSLEDFPEEMPFTIEEALNNNWMPS